MDPGTAAHHHSASKTRVNALMVLRGIRGTAESPSAQIQLLEEIIAFRHQAGRRGTIPIGLKV
jgi:hypothetical protein